MTDVETVQMLQDQAAAMQQQMHIQFAIIVLLIVALGVTVMLLYRSVPPGHMKDTFALLNTVLRDSTGEILKKLETQAPTTDSIVDDAIAIAGNAIHNAVYPTTTPTAQAATVEANEGAVTAKAEVTVEVTTEEK